MMVTPIIIFGKLALTIVGSAKLTTPNHQGFIQQASLFQIGYQGGTRLVYIFTLTYNLPWQVVVCIPALMIELHKTNPIFTELSCKQAVSRKRSRHQAIRSIHFDNRLRLLAHVSYLWYSRLHTVCHFVLLHFGINFWVAKFFIRNVVQLTKLIQHSSSVYLIYTCRIV